LLFFVIQQINAQTSFTLDGHTFLLKNQIYFELKASDTLLVDTLSFTIKFTEGDEITGINNLVNTKGFKKLYTYPNKKCTFKCPENMSYTHAYNLLLALNEIETISIGHLIPANYLSALTVPDDEHQVLPLYWELQKTSVAYWEDWMSEPQPYAWSLSVGHPSVSVAVLDDGLAWSDSDFSPDNLLGWDYISNDGNTEPLSGYRSHGTAMASIIAARTSNQHGLCGIAGGFGETSPPITLIIQKVITNDGLGPYVETDVVPSAIYDAIYKGARIINMSWGGQGWFDVDINDALNYAASEGIILFAAVGNEDNPTVSWPASHPDVIAVSGTTKDDERWSVVHDGSNTGNETEISFPGHEVEITQLPVSTITSNGSGTSISCAMASGVAALMLSVNPCLTNEEVRNILRESCEQVGGYDYHNSDPTNPGHSLQLGYGRVNAYTAVLLAKSHNDITINANEVITWNQNQTLTGTVTIKGNGTLNIEQCEITAHPSVKIIVEPGGKLYIDESVLKNYCGAPWQGIQVWGNSTMHQWLTNGVYAQGYVEITNSTIENAICALDLWKPGDYTKTGGIIIANNSTFRNNTRSIHALDYRNFNPSIPSREMDYQAIFNTCTFEITSDYIPGYEVFYKHIDLSKVKGVKFNACDFNLSPNVNGVSEWNQAIAAYNAGFSVNAICKSHLSPCEDYDNSTFTGFYTGINAIQTMISNYNTFYVNRTVFNNNTYGIRVFEVDNEIILNSVFNIAPNVSKDKENCASAAAYGIYLENSTGFAIEENSFAKATGAPIENYHGIHVKNTNSVDEIYKNSFTGLSFANFATGTNWGEDHWKGLAYFCNNNTGNYADFYVEKAFGSGIQLMQGDDFHPANNTFSPSGATWHFYNGSEFQIGYYYCATCPGHNPDDDKIYHVTDKAVSVSSPCVSHYGDETKESAILDNQQKLVTEQEFIASLDNYNGVLSLYNTLKDGGSTESKISDIASANPDDMWALRAGLLGDSPHLSEEVLKLVADRTDVFTEAAIFDILAANPDELKNEELLSYLEEKDNPLPAYMIDILRQVSTGTTYKTVLQQEMARYNRSKSRAANDMIRSYLNDTETDLVMLRNWLDNLGGIESDKQIISTFMKEGNYTNAFALANLLPQLYNLTGAELEEHTRYMFMMNLEQTLNTESRKLDQLSATELYEVNALALISDGTSGTQARGILEAFYGGHFCNCPNVDGETSQKNTLVNPNELGQAYGLTIAVSPNPAKDWTAFDYTLPVNATSAILLITDNMGRKVENFALSGKQGQKIWDTRKLKSGTYIYTLNSAGFVKSGKVLIVK